MMSTAAQTTFEGLDIYQSPERVNTNFYARMREMVVSNRTFTNLKDVEKLATIISFARGNFDAFTLAENLMDTFGSLKGVLEARLEQLMTVNGMNAARAQLLQLIIPMVRMWSEIQNETPDRIANTREAENYCLALNSGERVENFYVIALNARCNILGARKICSGSLSEVDAYPRLVAETALNYNAHSVLLCHNHPGGTCAASPEDISSTLQLQRLLGAMGILVLDHIIVAGDKTYSMIQHGDIDYRTKRV